MGFARSVLVTGANRGLGLEFIKQMAALADNPDHIFACCRDPDGATDLKEIAASTNKAKVHLVKMEVINDDDIKHSVEYVSKIVGDKGLNLIINNAGVLDRTQTDVTRLNRDALIDSFNINTLGPLFVSVAFLPLLKKAAQNQQGTPMSSSKAAIINISAKFSSITDNFTGGKGFESGYACRLSKTALNQATRCLAMDLQGDQIMCVSLLPGHVQTDITMGQGPLTPEESISSMLDTITKFRPEHNGGFYTRHGEAFPW